MYFAGLNGQPKEIFRLLRLDRSLDLHSDGASESGRGAKLREGSEHGVASSRSTANCRAGASRSTRRAWSGRGPYNHVVLDDTRISRQHAKISPEAGGHVVYDLNSANGTFVNDVQVKRQKLSAERRGALRAVQLQVRVEALSAPVAPGRDQAAQVRRGAHPGRRRAAVEDHRLARRVAGDRTRAWRTAATSSRTPTASCARSTPSCSRSRPRSTQGELLERILRNLLDVVPDAETVAVYLREPTSATMEPRRVLRRDERPAAASTLPGQFHEEVVGKGRADPVGASSGLHRRQARRRAVDARADDLRQRRARRPARARRRRRACVAFNQRDLDLLTGLASQAAMALQNARMHAGVAQAAAAAAGSAARRADPEELLAAAAAVGGGHRVRHRLSPRLLGRRRLLRSCSGSTTIASASSSATSRARACRRRS